MACLFPTGLDDGDGKVQKAAVLLYELELYCKLASVQSLRVLEA